MSTPTHVGRSVTGTTRTPPRAGAAPAAASPPAASPPEAVPPGSDDAGAPAPARPAEPDLPEQTVDDTDLGWGEPPRQSGHESWLREQRPPHWG